VLNLKKDLLSNNLGSISDKSGNSGSQV